MFQSFLLRSIHVRSSAATRSPGFFCYRPGRHEPSQTWSCPELSTHRFFPGNLFPSAGNSEYRVSVQPRLRRVVHKERIFLIASIAILIIGVVLGYYVYETHKFDHQYDELYTIEMRPVPQTNPFKGIPPARRIPKTKWILLPAQRATSSFRSCTYHRAAGPCLGR